MKLSEKERAELRETFRSTQDRRLTERCQAVLMAEPAEQIAGDVCAGVRTVDTWLRLDLQGGLAALHFT